MKRKSIFLLAALSAPAMAQELEEVVINAHPLADSGFSQSVKVLSGDELSENVGVSLGETLARLPGVRSASFGVAAGQPVIHGLSGPRVKTTQDRIDTLDVSVTSTDHAVTVEPFLADQITILKGASVLVYGAGSIGGVVDTQTGRIPKEVPEQAVSGRAEVRFTDNADAQVGALRLDGAAGEQFAWHVDVFSKDGDAYDIPVGAESAAQLAADGEEPEPGAGILENSFFDSQGGAIGFSWVGENGFIGASISTTESVYGLVGGHEEGEEGEEGEFEGEGEEEEENPFIDLEQTRIDIEAEQRFDNAFITKVNFRIGINDYEHIEFEAPGEAGTLFDNDAWEARLHLEHTPVFGFTGTYGVQLGDRDFSALGEEAFVPPVNTESMGAFWVGERQFGDNLSLELGSRIDRVEHTPIAEAGAPISFTSLSSSAGLVFSASEENTLSALLDFTERAPVPEELFSNGPHLATQTFDIGNADLEEESVIGLSVAWQYESEAFDSKITFYYNDFSDFIFQNATGLEEDGLPVFVYQQADAEFTGIDIEAGLHLAEFGGGDLDVLLAYDMVSVDLTGGDNLPRIPSDRASIGLDWHSDVWQAKLTYARQDSQTDNASFELPTDSFDDVSLRLSTNFDLQGSELSVFLHGKNLTDEEQREHTSFVKDFAPLPGRRIEVGLQLNF